VDMKLPAASDAGSKGKAYDYSQFSGVLASLLPR
jgi:hypothetical protein